MTTQNKNGNGVAAKENPKSNTVAVANIKEDGQKEQPAASQLTQPPAVIKKEVPEMPPVEDRILKVYQLYSVVEKHETLLETRRKLNAFNLSTDGNRDTLRIQDSRGNEFTTSNSAVIGDVIERLKTSLESKISEVENQIRF